MSLDEVRALDMEEVEMLGQAVTVLESREILVSFSTADFPHLKKEARKKQHRDIHKEAFPKIHSENAEEVSTEQLAKLLGGAIDGRRED